MHIGIDGSEANEKVRVGSSEYAYNLLHELYRISCKNNIGHKFTIFLKQERSKDLPPENSYWKYQVMPASSFWIIRKLVPYLWKSGGVDVFFSPSHYLPIFIRAPQVCTIHDLGYLMFSEQFRKRDFWQLKLWSAISVYISKYIISVSNSTKQDIVRHYKNSAKKIKVIYHGVDKKVFNSRKDDNLVRRTMNKYKISKNYILSIGTLKPSKNIEGIINAFSLFNNTPSHKGKFMLVIAGKAGWIYDEIFSLTRKLRLEGDVVFTGYLPVEDKVALMKGAYAIISPSFWEGFGMHILEAMSCGKPVIVSASGSISEVAGECGIYVDPYSIESIELGIKKLAEMSKTEYNKQSARCIKQADKFNWEKTARETLDVLERAGNK